MLRAIRRGVPAALALTAALALAGCAGSSTPPSETPAAGCLDVPAGPASDSVTVDGAFGGTPTATFDTPVSVDETERTVVTKGDGEVPEDGAAVQLVISIFSAASGDYLGGGPTPMTLGEQALLPAFEKAIDCQPIGSRTVTVGSPADLYGDQGNEQLGVAPGESAVIVVDVEEAPEPEPLPTPGAWTDNPPTVDFPADGSAPTLTLSGDPQPELVELVLAEGDGAEVQLGDRVTVNYQGTNVDTGEIFDQSYGAQPVTFGTGEVITGFGAALVGQKVGSKVVVSIPPALAYGAEPSDANPLAGHTLVFVVEILDTATS